MIVYKQFNIESARSLPNLPQHHPCSKVHGHSFKIILYFRGEVDKKTGFVYDFNDIDNVFKPLKNKLDHVYLNDIDGLENPSSENICIWIWEKVKSELPGLHMIEIKETTTTGCKYSGERID